MRATRRPLAQSRFPLERPVKPEVSTRRRPRSRRGSDSSCAGAIVPPCTCRAPRLPHGASSHCFGRCITTPAAVWLPRNLADYALRRQHRHAPAYVIARRRGRCHGIAAGRGRARSPVHHRRGRRRVRAVEQAAKRAFSRSSSPADDSVSSPRRARAGLWFSGARRPDLCNLAPSRRRRPSPLNTN